jgi:YfdX protein
MKAITRFAVTPVVAVLASVLATGSVATLAATTNKVDTETVTISTYSDWGDPAMAKIAVDSGRALVDHLQSAQALLATGKIREARSALVTSREFADAIQRTMPYLTVVEDMQDAGKKVVKEDVTAFSADLLPIYASLDELQLYAPKVADRTRGMVQKAEKNASAGDRQDAAQLLTDAADDISQHTIYLPVNYVDEQVHGAIYALNQTRPDVSAAKAAVSRALDSVTLVVDEVIGTPG